MPAAELAALALLGACSAAATAFVDLNLRVPGHAILRAVLPMACGLALVPRKWAGCVMGAHALIAALVFQLAGWANLGVGAMTSLGLTGPLFDLSLWGARQGGRLYWRFAAGGLACNLVALAVRAVPKFFGWESGRRPFGDWISEAAPTYTVCGLLAGLIGAMIWFRFTPRRETLPASGMP